MSQKIVIRQAPLSAVMEAHAKIPEFVGAGYDRDAFEERLKGEKSLLSVAFSGKVAAGYMVSYEREEDGSIYCWMAGVAPEFRRNGILTGLMLDLEKWAKAEGYKKVTIKTRNSRREMLMFLVRNGFDITHVQPKGKVSENRILLEKKL